jgi:hypothetical protein
MGEVDPIGWTGTPERNRTDRQHIRMAAGLLAGFFNQKGRTNG